MSATLSSFASLAVVQSAVSTVESLDAVCRSTFDRARLTALTSGFWLLLACLWLTAPSFAAPPTWDGNAQGQFITSLCRDTSGYVWIGTEDQGVWRCDPSAPAGQQYTHYTTKDGLGDDNAYALTCDKAGRIWVGTLNHGVSVFNGKAWRTYGPVDGPLGSRVFALAVSPKDGGVWGATEAGLFRYVNSRWTYFTRAEGLPSDQANALAFGMDGTLYVGTQCDGIAVGSPNNNYKTWRVTPGPAALPNAASGRGLPSALINCLLVTSDNTLFAGTTTGLAKSRDGGETWTFVRGLDWKAKLAGLYHPVAPAPSTFTGDLLTEDYVTSLAEDGQGRLFVGHRQTGVEAFDPKTGKRLQSGASGAKTDSYAFCLLVSGRSAWVGQYGGGLLTPLDLTAEAAPAPASSQVATLPVPAAPPTLTELNTMLAKVKSLKGEVSVGSAAYLGEDWQTQGDWVGRYGRQYALLCAMQSPWGDHLPIGSPHYSVRASVGPHHTKLDSLRSYIQWVRTDNPKSIYNPEIGYRRQAEHDDHGEDYDATFDGPDVWYTLTLPSGSHRVSLYFMNKDGHDVENRYRDYLVQVKPYRISIGEAETLPALVNARVRDFWGGVYKQFLLPGPNKYYIKVGKNNSHNTVVSAVVIDKMEGEVIHEEDMQTVWLGNVRYDPPDPGIQRYFPTLTTARTLWEAMDSMYTEPLGLTLQTHDRLFAYRSILQDHDCQSLLDNWRWNLNLWSATDRNKFGKTMNEARSSLLSINPRLKSLNN